MLRTLIVIPCFNEANRLPVSRLLAFAARAPEIGFVLVDDGSTDETLSRLRSLESADPGHFIVLAGSSNRGKAEAVRTGVLLALERAPAYVGYWDADLATPLEEIPRFERVLADRPACDAVFGARVQLLGRSIRRSPLRHYLGRVFATFASRVLGLPIYDTQCGAKLFRVNAEIGALFAERFLSPWLFDVEIVARMLEAAGGEGRERVTASIYELPLDTWHDVGASKVGLVGFVRSGIDLWRIRRRYRGIDPQPP